MSPLVIIGLLGGIPLLLGLILRVHTSAFFLSIAGGYLLALFVGDTASLLSRSVVPADGSGQVAQMVLFLLPALITLWLMRGSLSPTQIPLHFFPLLGCAVIVLVLGLQLLPVSVTNNVYAEFPGTLIKQMPDALVGISVALQLLLMWITARPRRDHDKHHGRSHHK